MRGLPRWVVVPAALGALFIVVPVAAMVARVDLGGADGEGFWSLVTSPAALEALWLSLRTSLLATLLCVVLGAPMALVLARTTFPGQRLVRSLVLLPLVLPPVVGGLALLYTFGRRGLIGERLSLLGIDVAFTTAAVVMAQTFVALPFLVLSLEGSLRTHDTRYEDVAATLGARPTTVLRRVTLPRVLPGLAGGAVLAFARALGEFGATITFAGALQGVTQTLPLQIYLERSADPDAAVALSLVLVVVAVVVTAGVHGVRSPRRATASGTADPGASASGTDAENVSRAAAAARGERAPSAPPVALHVRATVPERGLDVRLDVAPGEVVAVLGPNGAGKSTLLHAVAGLLPEHGATRVDVSTSARATTSVSASAPDAPPDGASAREPLPRAPHRRGVAWLGQRALLLDHLTVLDNVAFGPRAHGARRRDARDVARTALADVGAAHLADRRPGTLSGGQAQRVAIARALVTDPQVVLLDEPLASLDVDVAQTVRAALREAQRTGPRTTLLVTHDLLDVLLLADRAVVVEDGRIVEDAPARELLARPRSAFAARIAGVNLLVGTATGPATLTLSPSGAGPASTAEPTSGAEPNMGAVPVGQNDTHVGFGTEGPVSAEGPVDTGQPTVTGVAPTPAAEAPLRPGDPAVAVFSPAAVAVHRARPGGSPRNALAVQVTALEPHASLVRVRARTAGDESGTTELAADLTPAAVSDLGLAPGDGVWFVVKAAEVAVHAR